MNISFITSSAIILIASTFVGAYLIERPCHHHTIGAIWDAIKLTFGIWAMISLTYVVFCIMSITL